MFSLFKCRNCFVISSFVCCRPTLVKSCQPGSSPWPPQTGFQILCQYCSLSFQNSNISRLSWKSLNLCSLSKVNTGWCGWSRRPSKVAPYDSMSKRKRDLTRVTIHPNDELHFIGSVNLGTKETTRDMTSQESITLSDSDESEILVVYNYKEERARTALEIVLDDDGDTVEVAPSSSSDASNATVVNNVIVNDSNSSRPSRLGGNTVTRPNLDEAAEYNNESSCMEVTDEEIEAMRARIEQARFWEYTNYGSRLIQSPASSSRTMFSVMSYNVLSQDLLEAHPHLYTGLDPRVLSWDHRREILLKEFTLANADILCLQEVQESHMATFYNRLNGLGYSGVYKKRTGDKGDGAAIYFKKSMFTLKEHTSVEYYQPGVNVLNRDNIGLLVKLKVNNSGGKEIVVATTHLLYNPNRHDIKLAQVQLLLAEVERFAFVVQTRYHVPLYCPTIITGDLNLEPYTAVYRLLTQGMLRYHGLASNNLEEVASRRPLGPELIPRILEVTDTCQHLGVIVRRPQTLTHEEQRQIIKLYHSDYSKYSSYQDYVSRMKEEGFVNNFTPLPHTSAGKQRVIPEDLPREGFGTGQLSHHLNLRSVYNHGKYGTDRSEATTFQREWVTVDYIFYSCKYSPHLDKVIEGNLKLISRLRLPKRNDILHRPKIGRIPNAAAPSDHFPLAAVFLLS